MARKIFTESPEDEQWKLLLNYTFPHNVKKYFDKKRINNYSDELIEGICGSISQAKEYFDACKVSSLQIVPLLLYYGTTNLFYGITNLITGKINNITNHGMDIKIPPKNRRIADLEIIPRNPTTGGLSIFNNTFSKNSTIINGGTWSLLELFASIPDIYEDFNMCYEDGIPFIIPVEIIKEKNITFERIHPEKLKKFNNYIDIFSNIEQFSDNYLPIQFNPPQMNYIILRYKLEAKDIGIYALSGEKYLAISHIKNSAKITLSLEIIMLMAIFSLGFISRYHPEYWNPFIKSDSTGEKLIIEKFLYYERRILPNLLLNSLLQEKINFTNTLYSPLEPSNPFSKKDIQEIVYKELNKVKKI